MRASIQTVKELGHSMDPSKMVLYDRQLSLRPRKTDKIAQIFQAGQRQQAWMT